MTTLLVWASGHGNVDDDDCADIGKLRMLGGAVLFSALLAAINWGVAGNSYGASMPEPQRWLLSAVAALLGVSIVLIIDRCFLYLSDVGGPHQPVFKSVCFGLIRLGIVWVVSSITAQAVIPFLMNDELKSEALKMREASELERAGNLNTQFQVGDKQDAAKNAGTDLTTAQSALDHLPDAIEEELRAAKRCWTNYRAHKRSLIAAGFGKTEIRHRLGNEASHCSRIEQAAAAEKTRYLTTAKQTLTDAQARKKLADGALSTANADIQRKTSEAEGIEKDSFTPNSSLVLASLLHNNGAARYKYAMLTFLLMCLELLPLLLKLFVGQTNVGLQAYCAHKSEADRTFNALRHKEIEAAIEIDVAETGANAVRTALQNPDVQAIFVSEFGKVVGALAPLEAVGSLMSELERRQHDFERFNKRHPRFAKVVAAAYSEALKQSATILRTGSRLLPPHENGSG